MIPLDKARKRYANDVHFRMLVDVLITQVLTLELTPSELREAAVFACILVEERRPVVFSLRPDPSGVPGERVLADLVEEIAWKRANARTLHGLSVLVPEKEEP